VERFFLELDPPEEAMRGWPHVVVVGGGFAGLKLCNRLARQPLRVTLIDKRNFNLFQPLLYQVASGLVSEADVASPLRQMVGNAPNVQILLGEVTDILPDERQLVLNGQHFGYDQLVLATGSGSTYFGREEWRPLAPPMKILEHADEIRRRLLMALEEAEQTMDPAQRAFLQTVVVVGAGPAGCELAGSLIELMQRVLPTMAEPLAAAAAAHLQGAGVELRLGLRVEGIAPGRVNLSGATGEQQLEAATICWTAGVRASRLGRLLVEPDFSIAGHPEIRAVGDLCCYCHTADGTPLPGMAGPAVQAGGWVTRDILARLRGNTNAPFRWLDLGCMAVIGAVIGPWTAVADLRGLHLTGLAGWLVWALAHLAFIPDTENRIALFSKWMWQIATRQRTALLITGRPDQHLGVDVGLFRAERPELSSR
jgi:NADH dehydrogenase